jgi:hypothetical protein
VHEALRNPQLSAKANGGHPAIAATARPAAFSGPGVVGAKGAPPLKPVTPPAHTPPANAETRPTEPAHPQTAATRPPTANTNVSHAPPAAAHPGAPAPKAAPKTAAKPAPKPKPEEKNEK